jgi:peroxiredoxin
MDRNEESAKSLFDVTIFGIPFLIRTSARERLDITLRQAKAISVRNKPEQIGSENCYVIDAKTASGAYTVWIDPQHDYHIAQAEIRVGPGEKYRSRILDEGERCLFFIRNTRFEKIDGIWIPMEVDTHTEKISPDPDLCRTDDTTNKIIQITLNPDHEALGSFVPDIENGTLVIDRDSGVRYTWREGMKFVVDEWDGRTKYVPEDWSILVGVGKPLPEFEGIVLDVTAEDIRDNVILLCFFNMNQRPSRNCLLQLSKRTKELKAKGVAVIAIQAWKLDEEKLNVWVKKNNIPFPIGMIQSDEEKIRFTWGVRSLPWLILADKEHIVRAEGFGVDTLDDEIKKISLRDMEQ